MDLHIKKGEQQFGPYSRDQIVSFLEIGFIKLSNLASIDGVNGWAKLSEMEEFAKILAPAPAPNVITSDNPADPNLVKKKTPRN